MLTTTFISITFFLATMYEEELPFLLYIAQQTELAKECKLTTSAIAAVLQFSQQTASRKLIELEEKGFISRQIAGDGIIITLLPKGKEVLDKHFILLRNLYTNKKELIGKVKAGLGEGKFYMQMKQYKEAIEAKLKFTPYPGTLNLQVNPAERKAFLMQKELIKIEGFKTKERAFGGIFCYPVIITKNKLKINGALILPERTNHPEDVAELIAPSYLRELLKLKDGESIEVS